jgi:hypothetical protein
MKISCLEHIKRLSNGENMKCYIYRVYVMVCGIAKLCIQLLLVNINFLAILIQLDMF